MFLYSFSIFCTKINTCSDWNTCTEEVWYIAGRYSSDRTLVRFGDSA